MGSMNKNVKEQIKSMLAAKSITMKEIAYFLSKKREKNYSLENLSSKLRRGTLQYNVVVLIADYLGYDIEFKEG